jgi:hypothetical protein
LLTLVTPFSEYLSMTTAVETNPNGRDRKTLASQLDRLDNILDGLADALNESVAAAVHQAVAGVLTEILTNPTFADRLRGPLNSPGPEIISTDTTTPPPPSGPGLVGKAAGALRAGCGSLQRAGGAVLRRAAVLAGSGRSYLWGTLFRGRLVPLAGAIIMVGLVVYLAGARLPLLLTGAVGWGAALIARARASLRRAPTQCMSSFQ